MTPRIALLGWGSLLWDPRPEFDEHREPWELDGPRVRIEFSRVSRSRRGALTLVVDPMKGVECLVAHARSRRRNPEDAICDLRSREGTTGSNIGCCFLKGSRHRSKDPATLAAIRAWAEAKAIDVVVWTDLPSNFQDVTGRPFTIEDALAHVQGLEPHARAGAAEYIRRAPDFVDTPLRRALGAQPWFIERQMK